MKHRGILTVAALALVSFAGFTPAASADETTWVIESANGSEDVWTQDPSDTTSVLGSEYYGSNLQRWVYDFDHDTLRNIGTGRCATAVDRDKIKGRACDNDDPGQKWTRRGSGNSRQIVNTEFRTCAEYRGLNAPLRLRDCDAGDAKQQWYLNEP
ncbi:ricin-type beta-trefoil lectin domain protein [Kibdelosporangium phytohabitans]|uniref:Ricin B lectin domain-containing protein n=1 Tax=Kibdelosporangium phytohabitans TaxID=860235 RepID=A0A0N9HZD9_9PSEU|nr:ricin-type beta-trefoil lectin domain protein [Kibdelosporangium phytohabitans]ALG10707.1 hypothetical protein AOZ06_30840 [Kibdelosporangium phytohabitans]MBE1461843.1 hypothetical protein [Kibdelosporangium phytohabitans]